MNLMGTARINGHGYLEIGGVPVPELAARYGTPLYIMDEELIRQSCRNWREAARTSFPRADVAYACKAFCTLAMCRLAEEEGLALDVVSGGELYTALTAGFPAGRIYFNGNNKSPAELEQAVRARVGRIIVDNFFELDLLEEVAARLRQRVSILLRISPGIEAHTHAYVQTGQLDSKFGFTLENGQALAAVEAALTKSHLELRGLHCHIGSQIFALDGYVKAAQVMIDFLSQIRLVTGLVLEELDLGGGLGVFYSDADAPVSPAVCVGTIAGAVKAYCQETGFPLPKIIFEPGRSIVGPAGTAVYRVGARKEIPDVRTYVAVDGGMADNPRPALYGSRYSALVANKANHPPAEVVTIAGKCCESGDVLIQDINLPRLEPGDLIAMFTAGAYQYSMASNYNRLPRPAVVFVRDGQACLVVQRESLADLVRNDRLPREWEQEESLRAVK
ncbi:MAG TPA: diaminopimelate decarboxylase [Firmicutes bacterium]|nr:diaminopimelate decarboxylase [Bacillota bacterium]